MSNGNVVIIHSIVELKKTQHKKNQYFPKLYRNFGGHINVKVDLEKKISGADKKFPVISGLVKKLDFNAKITEIESKMPSISGLATNAALTAVENKMPVSQKKKIIEKKVTDHNHDKQEQQKQI